METELARRSPVVLITTLPATRLDAATLLREYKGQTSGEQRVHFLKDPAFVDAVFLKKPDRIEALGYVMLLALLVFSWLERRVRQSPEPLPTLMGTVEDGTRSDKRVTREQIDRIVAAFRLRR